MACPRDARRPNLAAVILFAALAADRGLAVAAAITYALAYTFELGLSLVFYFGAAQQRTGPR